jgi:hypothetical protein
MKNFKRLSALLAALGMGTVGAREIGTPLPLQFAPHYTYGIYRPYDKNEECPWYVTVGWGGYFRSAGEAYTCGTCTEPYSALLFGKSDFRLAEAFADATVGTASDNPFVTISTLTPRYEYVERGAMFWAYMGGSFGCDDQWKYGLRLRLPIRDVQLQQVCGNDLEGETLDDVYQKRLETIEVGNASFPNTVFAARLDFLATLQRVSFNTSNGSDPLVVFVNADTAPANQITIADQTVADGLTAANAIPAAPDSRPMIAAIKQNDGFVPTTVRWGDVNSAITGVVEGDGAGLNNDQRGRFASDINYAALGGDMAAQRQLFIVPTIQNAGDNQAGHLTGGASTIFGAIEASVNAQNDSVLDFIEEAGLNFCDGRSKGLGDFDTELYLGRKWGCTERWFTELQFGVRFPTADKLCDCKQLIKPALGSNGHYQLRGGITAAVDAARWIRIKGEFKYNWALKRTENIAAPFKGATIKNIGPCIGADISWDYLLADLDITLLASDCCGMDLGYEVYHKRCDKIRLCAKTATDLIGRANQALDASVAQRGTEVTSHKIRAEMFMKPGECEFFTGFDYAVAGKNAPREMDVYFGMMVNF